MSTQQPPAAPVRWTGAHQRAWDQIRLELEEVVTHAQRLIRTHEGAEQVTVLGPDGREHQADRWLVTLWREPCEAVNRLRANAGLAPIDEFTIRTVEHTSTGADYRSKYALRLADLVIDGDPRFPAGQ